MTRSAMAQQQQQSSALELVDDAAILPGIAAGVFEKDARPVLLYDGVCNMCNGFVNLFLDIDKDEKFRFSALQSQTGRALLALSGRSPDDISRYTHIVHDKYFEAGQSIHSPVCARRNASMASHPDLPVGPSRRPSSKYLDLLIFKSCHRHLCDRFVFFCSICHFTHRSHLNINPARLCVCPCQASYWSSKAERLTSNRTPYSGWGGC